MATPLKVTCWLDGPLAGDAPDLAALCEFAMACKMRAIMAADRHGRHQVSPHERGADVGEPGKIPIPIERQWLGRFPMPLCSSPIMAAPWHEDREFINKKLAVEQAEFLATEQRKTVDTGSGHLKSYRLPLRLRSVERVVWFCQGHKGGLRKGKTAACWLRQVLRGVRAIGKKTADGYGAVRRWDVEHFDHSWHWFAPSAAGPVLMRPLPLGDWLPEGLLGAKRWYSSPCPPLWQRSLYTEIVVPC